MIMFIIKEWNCEEERNGEDNVLVDGGKPPHGGQGRSDLKE